MFSTLNKRGPLLLGILTVDLFVFCLVNYVLHILHKWAGQVHWAKQ